MFGLILSLDWPLTHQISWKTHFTLLTWVISLFGHDHDVILFFVWGGSNKVKPLLTLLTYFYCPSLVSSLFIPLLVLSDFPTWGIIWFVFMQWYRTIMRLFNCWAIYCQFLIYGVIHVEDVLLFMQFYLWTSCVASIYCYLWS